MKVYKKIVKKKELYREYVSTLNSLLKLSERELDILAVLVSIDLRWPEDEIKNVIDERSRRKIMSETLVNKNNLSKYISKMKRKKVLISEDNINWVVNEEYIMSSIKGVQDSIKLVFLLEIE